MSYGVWTKLGNSKCCTLKTKDVINLKTWKKAIFRTSCCWWRIETQKGLQFLFCRLTWKQKLHRTKILTSYHSKFKFSRLLIWKQKVHGLNRFHGNGPYGKIPTKKEPITTLEYLPFNNTARKARKRENSIGVLLKFRPGLDVEFHKRRIK